MTSLHRFLFAQLGRSLTWTARRTAVERWRGGALEEAKVKGLLRELPAGPVDCPSPTCTEGCVIRPVADSGLAPRMVRLPCHLGHQNDLVIPEDDTIFLEGSAAGAFALFCRSNDMACLVEKTARPPGPAVLLGRVPWADGAALWFVSTPRRLVGEAELAPILVSSHRPALVLVPPDRTVGPLDVGHLASARVHLLEMDRCVDWSLLELNRLAITARMSAATTPGAAADPQAVLVLNVTACEASYSGHKLGLGPREFGVLLALARNPGQTVRKDALSDMAYRVRNDVASDDREDDPGQLNKFVTHIRNAIRDVASENGIEDVDDRGFIKAKKPIGYYLTELSVRIID